MEELAAEADGLSAPAGADSSSASHWLSSTGRVGEAAGLGAPGS